MMEFNYDEEVICDHTVTPLIKKVWAKEIELLNIVDDICKRHNLRYYIFYGSLLGAVRHKGFVPWDDDIDIAMPRPDYMQFLKIAEEEIKEPYFLQTAYTDMMTWAFAKLRDSRTTAVEFPDMPEEFNQGIFIDIFPLDAAMDGSAHMNGIYRVVKDIWRCIFNRQEIFKNINNEELYKMFVLDRDTIIEFIQMSDRELMLQLEAFLEAHYNDSDKCCVVTFEMVNRSKIFDKKWFDESMRVPFCNIEVSIPVMYDEILKLSYGDYMTPVKGLTLHEGIYFDPDMPYKEWLKKYKEDKNK